MKKSVVSIIIIAGIFFSCSVSSSPDKAGADSSSTAADTITNVTNPGVGTAADDTLRKP